MQTGLQLRSGGRLAELSPFGITLPQEQAPVRLESAEEGYGCVDWYQYTDVAVEQRRVANHAGSPLGDQSRP
jgi:hypothetical protein